ncbi:hypothetical protein GCM10010492_59910 [Saccharothrix mutabilis subsp. mutabilis]|uniref:Uncharacterized protein n=2 Tax=Saccharothrix mutabilis TaxID=33921 RepID=A0ABN0UI71_9PSEU
MIATAQSPTVRWEISSGARGEGGEVGVGVGEVAAGVDDDPDRRRPQGLQAGCGGENLEPPGEGDHGRHRDAQRQPRDEYVLDAIRAGGSTDAGALAETRVGSSR